MSDYLFFYRRYDEYDNMWQDFVRTETLERAREVKQIYEIDGVENVSKIYKLEEVQ